jgi:hypothetical protein
VGGGIVNDYEADKCSGQLGMMAFLRPTQVMLLRHDVHSETSALRLDASWTRRVEIVHIKQVTERSHLCQAAKQGSVTRVVQTPDEASKSWGWTSRPLRSSMTP